MTYTPSFARAATPNTLSFTEGTPAAEPASLANVKLTGRVDGTEDDALLTAYIKTARVLAEHYTNQRFINRSITVWLDGFPTTSGLLAPEFAPYPGVGFVDARSGSAIELPVGPWSAATLKLVGEDGSETTVAASVYFLDASAGRLCLNDGQTWPALLRDRKGIKIEGTVGYGAAAANVPENAVTAVEMLAVQLYQTKGGTCEGGAMPASVKGLLEPLRKVAALGVF